MRKTLTCLAIMIIIAVLFVGCSPKEADTIAEQQLKEYQTEIERLKQENTELRLFKERSSINLYKIEETLYALKDEGSLPFAGSQVNALELFVALKDIRNISLGIEEDELVLKMMPQEWSGDFNTILIAYDVYKSMTNMTNEDSGKVSKMAGVFKKVDGRWTLVKFTRNYTGDEGFGIKDI